MRSGSEVYDLQQDKDVRQLKFYFRSSGDRRVLKIIGYSFLGQMMGKDLYNLGFGDIDRKNNCIIDHLATGNGDVYKVLNTVLSTIPLFFENFRDAILMVKGSDGSPAFSEWCRLTCRKHCEQHCRNANRRIKIYRGYVNKYFKELCVEYQFLGEYRDRHQQVVQEAYQPHRDYEAVFLFKKA